VRKTQVCIATVTKVFCPFLPMMWWSLGLSVSLDSCFPRVDCLQILLYIVLRLLHELEKYKMVHAKTYNLVFMTNKKREIAPYLLENRFFRFQLWPFLLKIIKLLIRHWFGQKVTEWVTQTKNFLALVVLTRNLCIDIAL